MSIKSNVTIKSNIQVNKTGTKSDIDFLRHVFGYDAIRKIKEDSLNYKLLTDIQKAEYKYGEIICPYDDNFIKSGDKVRGRVKENGKTIFVNKCDQRGCEHYQKCSGWSDFRKINRANYEMEIDEEQYIAPDFSLIRYLDAEDKIIYLKRMET